MVSLNVTSLEYTPKNAGITCMRVFAPIKMQTYDESILLSVKACKMMANYLGRNKDRPTDYSFVIFYLHNLFYQKKLQKYVRYLKSKALNVA